MTDVTTRRMQPEDLTEGLRLTRAESWSYRLEDWSLHFRLGKGWVACDAGGRVLGTALWWPYGERYATVGLVVVDRHQQGKGIGRKLMNAVMEDAGTRSLQLVATRAGMRLYEQCGFHEHGAICQHQGVATAAASPLETESASLRAVTSADLATIAHRDADAFGTDRTPVLAAVLAGGEGLLASRDGRLAGYALAREAGRGTTIGPVVAEDERLAIGMVSRLLQRRSGIMRLDVPADAAVLRGWLESSGIACIDTAAVMLRGTPMPHRGAMRLLGLVSQALT